MAQDTQRVVLGNFKLLHVLGQGSFATAYLAEQIGTDRKAVVKIAHAHLVHGEQGKMIRGRFAAEVRAATRVTHPNLVTIYTAGETDDGLPALAMEHLEGETLGQRLRRGERLTFEELYRGFAQLASALSLVHANRIIHRDVSPDNVFLSRGHDGFAIKLIDFGIARVMDLTTAQSYAMVGTPFYTALEQIRGAPTTASDVYSVGALLWWSLTGERLYSTVTRFDQLLYMLESQREPPDPCQTCQTLPAKVGALVGSMLHHQAAERPTMGAFLVAWAELEPELHEWCISCCARRVGVLASEGPMLETLTRALGRGGHRVVRLEPRVDAVRAEPDLDAIVIDAELSGEDPIALVLELAEALPQVRRCAVSGRPFASAWLSAPVMVCALLPEQLPALTLAIARQTPEPTVWPSSSDPASEFARRALGEIPELLAQLNESIADRPRSIQLCELIERIAHLAELGEMLSLARTFRVLLERQAVDEPAGFVAEMNRSFRESFPALLARLEIR
jgi:serine/threonine protein kinase